MPVSLVNHQTSHFRKRILAAAMLLPASSAFATPPGGIPGSSISNPAIILSVVAIAGLALVIAILSNTVVAAKSVYRERIKKQANMAGATLKAVSLLIAFLLTLNTSMAQNAETVNGAAPVSTSSLGSLPAPLFYLIVAVVVLELIVIMFLLNILKFLTGIERKVVTRKMPVFSWPVFTTSVSVMWTKMNRSVAIEKEKDIDLSHDYDGIRELDNSIPPWWKWAFAATFVFAVVYVYRYNIVKSAPLQVEELQMAMRQADIDKEVYLKTSASNVDEQSVKMLDADGIAAGKTLFTANCTPCHGHNGEGNTVGPNLTDDYWLHKGAINDIFKTIKYGWVEKGMKSWKDDFAPPQIAQLASFVKSLHNSNPPNAKAPQGERFSEGAATVSDSLKPLIAADTRITYSK